MFVSLALLKKKRQELDALEAEWLADLHEYDRSGDWQAENYVNASSALQDTCRMDPGVAKGYVDLARKLARLPEVAAAFGQGEISSRHASVIAGAYTPARAEELANIEAELVRAAREHRPKDLSGIVRYVTDQIDGDGGASRDEIEYERRACYAAKTLFGAFDLTANGDQLNGDIITRALDAEMAKDLQAQDSRPTPQRRFDALTAISWLYLEHGDTGESHGIRPHALTVADVDELPSRTADTTVRVPSKPRRNTYSSATLGLLLCDCDMSRVIMAGQSEVLDVGRATRTVSAAQWKALVARDRHCTAPGCTRPPDHCEAHHIYYWEYGGPTDLANLRLLCWHHHRREHIEEAKTRALDAGTRDP